MKPLITVVTITYNCIDAAREESLIQCVESVRSQSYENIEHLIIDGASIDGTLDVLKKFDWLKIYSEKDSGVFNAFNKGILKARGKYIVFINSDDYFSSEDAVSLSVVALENSKADFCYGDTWLLDEDKPKKSTMRKPQLYKSFVKMPFCHQSMFCKTDVLKEIDMFDERNKIASDYDVYLKLLLKGYKGVNVNAQTAVFRCGGVSSDRCRFVNEMCGILKRNLSEFCCLSDEEALNIVENSSLPLQLALRLSKFLHGKDRVIFLLTQIRHFTFQIRTSKNKRMLKVFGIYLIKPKVV